MYNLVFFVLPLLGERAGLRSQPDDVAVKKKGCRKRERET
jgi:hypothetical protein